MGYHCFVASYLYLWCRVISGHQGKGSCRDIRHRRAACRGWQISRHGAALRTPPKTDPLSTLSRIPPLSVIPESEHQPELRRYRHFSSLILTPGTPDREFVFPDPRGEEPEHQRHQHGAHHEIPDQPAGEYRRDISPRQILDRIKKLPVFTWLVRPVFYPVGFVMFSAGYIGKYSTGIVQVRPIDRQLPA